MTATYLAARYEGSGVIRVATLDRRPPGPGQVEIAPAFTGICGTDLHVVHGAMDGRVQAPAVIGHETAGHVVAVGEDVTGWHPGDAVTVVPLHADGTCPACRSGHGHLCHDLAFLGIDSAGALAERWVVPADTLLRLPDGMSLRTAALLEPTAVAVHDVARARLVSGEHAVVVGGGPVGILIALVAREHGAQVLLIELDPARREAAALLGLDVLDPVGDDVAAVVLDRSEGAGAAVAFEVSGSQPGLDTAVSVLAVRGRLCQVGIHAARRTLDLHRVFWRELDILGARLYTRDDWTTAIDLVASGRVPVDALISTVVPLTEVSGAFTRLAGGGVVKVLVDCQPPTDADRSQEPAA